MPQLNHYLCSGCLTRFQGMLQGEPVCYACRQPAIPVERERWTITSRAGHLWLIDRATESPVAQCPGADVAMRLAAILNRGEDLTAVVRWFIEQQARLLLLADMAATAWLATVDLDHVPIDEAGTIKRFVEVTGYLETVESAESITQDILRPLATRGGWPGTRLLRRLDEEAAAIGRAIAELATLQATLDPASQQPNHRAACAAHDALLYVLEGREEFRPSLTLSLTPAEEPQGCGTTKT